MKNEAGLEAQPDSCDQAGPSWFRHSLPGRRQRPTDGMDSSPRRHQRANNHYGRLGTNPAQSPWGNAVEGGKNVGDERPKVDHPMTVCTS